MPGSNRRPRPCEGRVITTRLIKLCAIFDEIENHQFILPNITFQAHESFYNALEKYIQKKKRRNTCMPCHTTIIRKLRLQYL